MLLLLTSIISCPAPRKIHNFQVQNNLAFASHGIEKEWEEGSMHMLPGNEKAKNKLID